MIDINRLKTIIRERAADVGIVNLDVQPSNEGQVIVVDDIHGQRWVFPIDHKSYDLHLCCFKRSYLHYLIVVALHDNGEVLTASEFSEAPEMGRHPPAQSNTSNRSGSCESTTFLDDGSAGSRPTRWIH